MRTSALIDPVIITRYHRGDDLSIMSQNSNTGPMLTSIYADHIDALPPSQKDRPRTCDVAIIGGGLTGVTTALHLAEHGYDVVLLEAETIGSGGSGRNGGHLCQGWPNDFHHISNQLSADDADLAWAAGMAAVDLVASRVRKHNICLLYTSPSPRDRG